MGFGVVGQRLCQLLAADSVSTPVVVTGRPAKERDTLVELNLDDVDVVDISGGWDTLAVEVLVLSSPEHRHVDEARAALAQGCHVVSLADSASSVSELLSLAEFAREIDRAVIVGAAASPGLSTLLAMHGAALFETIEEIAIAVTGTAGTACIERRSRANRTEMQEWRDGMWVDCGPRSAPELVFFPDPVGSVECARGDLSEALLLRRTLPTVDIFSVKVAKEPISAVPRGFLKRRRNIELEPGAQRVSVSGWVDGASETVVYGAVASTRDLSADLAQLAAWAVLADHRVGAFGICEVLDAKETLRTLAERGHQILVYEGED
ncbi:MAG: hypothetical protein GX868_19045 [Actinobacteria bacterium]|nr:hypothetical protein [Actinomycetota bacterium]